MKFLMTGQEKDDRLIQVTAWTSLTVTLNRTTQMTYFTERHR